ncbi:MAG: hypothetical protein WDW38_006396 [Sanguina aurantia]
MAKDKHRYTMNQDLKQRMPLRRGELDELRTLIRVMVQVFPNSRRYYVGGGGEAECNRYLVSTLGDLAPPPRGVPLGWKSCLADWFTDILQVEVTPEQAGQCVTREQGRAWSVNTDALVALGVFPREWKHPLMRETVRRDNAAAQVQAGLQV